MSQAQAVVLQAGDKVVVRISRFHGHADILQTSHDAINWIFDLVGENRGNFSQKCALFQLLGMRAYLLTLAEVSQD